MEPNTIALRPTPVTTYPHDRYGLIRRDAALRQGITDARRANDVRDGQLITLIPGVDVQPSAEFDGHDGAQKLHRLRSIAVATSKLGTGPALPLSHSSAATMHGLPLLKPDLERVHVTRGASSGGSIGTHRHVHVAPIEPTEIVTIDGVAVTSLERTAVDVATSGTFAQALTVFDHALRCDADRALMHEMIVTRRRRNGVMAEQALLSANPLSGSVGESWSRAEIIVAGFTVPRLQHKIVVPSGRTYYTDFDWDWLLVGEFDGLSKYGRFRRAGESIADAVMREKRREDEIRGTGPMVARWIWADLERNAVIPMLEERLRHLGLIPR